MSDPIEAAMLRYLPGAPEAPLAPQLVDAMRYSALAGGKRVRARLTLAACRCLGGADDDAALPACAVEFVHTYSLIHDDLPAMDDDDLRRGKPTCHKVYGEANAILAGNGLLTHAVYLLATTERFSAETRVQMLRALTEAAGHRGMLAGQCLDMASEGHEIDRATLEALHRNKTGALICAAIELGALASGQAQREDFARFKEFGAGVGLAFQVVDDVLNASGDAKRLGKATGTDALLNKSTYVKLLGVDGAKRYAAELTERALQRIAEYGVAGDALRDIARELLDRDY